MEKTTNKWKENQKKALTSEALVEISYSISDPDLPERNAVANDELQLLSDIGQTADVPDRTIVPYATLEKKLWLLDGSKVTVPDDVPDENRGYVSDQLCDDTGSFYLPPTVTITFDFTVPLLPGLTITWGSAHEDYPTAFDIRLYDEYGQEIQEHSIADNNSVVSHVAFEMQNFRKIEIAVLRWNTGNRRARIAKIFQGIQKVYRKSELISFSSVQSVDPLSAKLPKYEVSFSIDNTSGEYNPNDPSSLSKYMMERQEIQTRYGFHMDNDEIEWIPGGLYFLSEWEAPQNGLSASFKARDLLGFLDGTYYKGEYHSEGICLYDLALDVLEEAKLPLLRNQSPRWDIDEKLKFITTKSPLPVCSFAECLQLIANAAQSVFYFDRNGTLHIKQIPLFEAQPPTFCINDDNCYSKAEIGLLKPLKRICVSAYGWQIGEDKDIYDGVLKLEQGENIFLIEYSDSAKDVIVKSISEAYSNGNGIPNEDIVIAKCYAKYCRLSISRRESDPEECHIVLSGTPLKSTETIVSVEHSDTGEIIPLKNILITDIERARDMGSWLKTRYDNRKNISVNWRVDPSIDVLDPATVSNGTQTQLTRVFAGSFSFSGAFKGSSEGVVIE